MTAYERRISDWSADVCSSDLLPNPHWDPGLRPLAGRDRDVAEYLDAQPDVVDYVAQVSGFLAHWLPRLKTDTRSYVTVAFGCTGGRHRSVYLAETMAAHARGQVWPDAATYHRGLYYPRPPATHRARPSPPHQPSPCTQSSAHHPP